jgi:hypothetical protein
VNEKEGHRPRPGRNCDLRDVTYQERPRIGGPPSCKNGGDLARKACAMQSPSIVQGLLVAAMELERHQVKSGALT